MVFDEYLLCFPLSKDKALPGLPFPRLFQDRNGIRYSIEQPKIHAFIDLLFHISTPLSAVSCSLYPVSRV